MTTHGRLAAAASGQSQHALAASNQRKRREAVSAAVAVPTAASIVELASMELLLELPRAKPESEEKKTLKEWLSERVDSGLRAAFGSSLQPAPTPGASSLLRLWRGLAHCRQRAALEVRCERLREATADWDERKQPTRLPLNAVLTKELRLRRSESVIEWLTRLHSRIVSKYLHDQNRTHKAAHGELKQQSAGAEVLLPAFTGGGNRTRDSDFASGMAAWQAESKLSAEAATKAVSDSAHVMIVIERLSLLLTHCADVRCLAGFLRRKRSRRGCCDRPRLPPCARASLGRPPRESLKSSWTATRLRRWQLC